MKTQKLNKIINEDGIIGLFANYIDEINIENINDIDFSFLNYNEIINILKYAIFAEPEHFEENLALELLYKSKLFDDDANEFFEIACKQKKFKVVKYLARTYLI